MSIRLLAAGAGLVAAVTLGGPPLSRVDAQGLLAIDGARLGGLTWRHIGPYRGGNTTAAAGMRSDPRVFYIGTAGGGIWKTGDYGQTWRPIFDAQPTSTIGALVVAPSDSRIIYAGSGAVLDQPGLAMGNGLYKSTDAGETWTHLGLADSGQIPQIAVHPTDPNYLLVAVLGHAYGPNPERGVFRSTDGGRTFERVLFTNDETGAVDVAFDPQDPATVYASLWQMRRAPWSWSGEVFNGPGSGVFKSSNGGTSWRPITGGLPTAVGDGVGRVGLTLSAGRPTRLFALVDARSHGGLYRSDDAGETWSLVSSDARLRNADLEADPNQPDVLYAAGSAVLRSADGGRTWTNWRSAPADAPYHRLWIHPVQPNVIILASSRGALVSVNGGETWSSGVNQPTAVFSQVTTDTAVPYRVCGGREAGGALCVGSGGGQPAPLEWPAPDPGQASYVAPDPADPDLIFLYGGDLRRYDRRTGQILDVTPPGRPASSQAATAPVVFSTAVAAPRALYFASSALWTSTTGGQAWTTMSPDLSRETWEVPPTLAAYSRTSAGRIGRRGAISTLAPSSIDSRVLWAGTDDGLVHLTRNQGATWSDVTPPGLTPWTIVTRLEASHFDTNTAYAAASNSGLDDWRPRLFRTRDAGATWTDISRGLPALGIIHVVREDSARRGLLFAAGDRSVYLSFDDGDSWQSLRLNLPPVPIRDLVLKDADLVVATAGRGLWILDDMSPLRQITADVLRSNAFLFRPPPAWRIRVNSLEDHTAADALSTRAPEGVAISYSVGAGAPGALTLEIVESASGDVIRRYSNADLSVSAGLHRVLWDLKYAPPAVSWLSETDAGGPQTDALSGRWAPPGTYQVRLTTGTGVLRQAVVVRMDPRVRTSAADLVLLATLAKAVDEALGRLGTTYEQVRQRQAAQPTPPAGTASDQVVAELRAAGRELRRVFLALQQSDARPTAATEAAAGAAIERAAAVAAQAR